MWRKSKQSFKPWYWIKIWYGHTAQPLIVVKELFWAILFRGEHNWSGNSVSMCIASIYYVVNDAYLQLLLEPPLIEFSLVRSGVKLSGLYCTGIIWPQVNPMVRDAVLSEVAVSRRFDLGLHSDEILPKVLEWLPESNSSLHFLGWHRLHHIIRGFISGFWYFLRLIVISWLYCFQVSPVSLILEASCWSWIPGLMSALANSLLTAMSLCLWSNMGIFKNLMTGSGNVQCSRTASLTLVSTSSIMSFYLVYLSVVIKPLPDVVFITTDSVLESNVIRFDLWIAEIVAPPSTWVNYNILFNLLCRQCAAKIVPTDRGCKGTIYFSTVDCFEFVSL